MSILKRIKREAHKNPAKAALLVGLLGLAFYAWAPLVCDWLGGGEHSNNTASRRGPETDQPARPVPSPSSGHDEINKTNRPSWKELQNWRAASPWTEPADLAELRNPFCAVRADRGDVNENHETSQESLAASAERALAGLAIRLTGTIVGPRRRVALVDGRTYREGDVVRIEQLGTTLELEVRRIEANRVTLAWNSMERVLNAPERPPVGSIELVERSD